MKYTSFIVKIVVSICILFSASTMTHASKRDDHRCHKKHHHRSRSKSCKSESESEARSRARVRTGSVNVPITITDTNAQAQVAAQAQAQLQVQAQLQAQAQVQAQLQAQIQNLSQQISACCNSSTNGTIPVSSLTFGGWFDGGTFNQTLVAGSNQTLDFVTPEVVNGIINVGGTFVFTQDGTYEVEVAVVASNDESPTRTVTTDVFVFQLFLNGNPVPGGVLEVQPRTPVTATSLNSVSVLIHATAGSRLALNYVNSCNGNNPCTPNSANVTVGPSQSPTGNSAFITITQLK